MEVLSSHTHDEISYDKFEDTRIYCISSKIELFNVSWSFSTFGGFMTADEFKDQWAGYHKLSVKAAQMGFDEFKDWCVRHKKLLISLGIAMVAVSTTCLYLSTVKGGVYLIIQRGYPFTIRYVGQTKSFATRKVAHLLAGYYDPVKHYFLKIPIPSVKDGLEEILINLLKPPLNRSYTVGVNAGRNLVTGTGVIISASAFFWRKMRPAAANG